MLIIYAIIVGVLFGFVLDRVGATNPNFIVKMLNFKNLHLMKAILLGIGTASILMFGGQILGLVDVMHMSVKTAYVGVLIGGGIMGFGWVLAGYCPGTSLVSAASGRKDALLFIGGGLAGALAYMLTFESVKGTGILDAIAGGKVTLGTVPGSKFEGFTAIQGDLLGIGLGALFIIVAFILPEGRDETV